MRLFEVKSLQRQTVLVPLLDRQWSRLKPIIRQTVSRCLGLIWTGWRCYLFPFSSEGAVWTKRGPSFLYGCNYFSSWSHHVHKASTNKKRLALYEMSSQNLLSPHTQILRFRYSDARICFPKYGRHHGWRFLASFAWDKLPRPRKCIREWPHCSAEMYMQD